MEFILFLKGNVSAVGHDRGTDTETQSKLISRLKTQK